ncbi:hypothetical protein D3C77_559140 [compost metagenome]
MGDLQLHPAERLIAVCHRLAGQAQVIAVNRQAEMRGVIAALGRQLHARHGMGVAHGRARVGQWLALGIAEGNGPHIRLVEDVLGDALQ